MKKHARWIITSPTPECLCLAAACWKEWERLEIGGRNWIETVIDNTLSGSTDLEMLVMLPLVQRPEKVKGQLRKLAARGVAVTWFAGDEAESVMRTCSGVPGVELFTGHRMADALARRFSFSRAAEVLIQDYEERNADLIDFLRYKTSLSFMQEMNPQPLVEAVEGLLGANGRSFSLRHVNAVDAASVEHFRDRDFPYIEGWSAPIASLKRRILQVAPTNLTPLILGETGTGKELVAFYLHAYSEYRGGPYVALNCAGLEENLLRSELFGHKKGSFTGAVTDKEGLVHKADGGTLFLDEIGEMPLPIQADLLRFLQSRRFRPVGGTDEVKVDVRFIAATQPTLAEKIRKGLFRDDLYYRLAEVEIRTPALREVPEDIQPMIRNIVYTGRMRDERLQEETLNYFRRHEAALKRYAWPGNVRELVAIVKRRLQLRDDVVRELLPGGAVSGSSGWREGAEVIRSPEDIQQLSDLTRDYVRGVFAQKETLGLNQQDVARRLGISVNTLKGYLRGKQG